MRNALVAAMALSLAGCGGVNYAMEHYASVTPVNFETGPGESYRIFDRPADNKLMITPSLASASGAGFVSGLTLGAVDSMDTLGPRPVFERAAVAYLRSTGRDCRIVDGFIVVKPQWEFGYDCRTQANTSKR